MSIYIKLRPIHEKCNAVMTIESKQTYDVLLCSKCCERMVLDNIDLGSKKIVDKLILI